MKTMYALKGDLGWYGCCSEYIHFEKLDGLHGGEKKRTLVSLSKICIFYGRI